ncbi:uncharacterized protein LOC119765476 [Culex quinquefasciatus]|uniref:uncharacterized protein LOC119765476 n=1 Tax=Culex quinquefasciatus TaxID=7176 RepID=UPI0018E2F98C|nr:uncharacterized protein LOC119765476 [Culex quinquefasciatus]
MARQLVDQFWRRWINEYLPTIAKRTKWHSEAENIQVDDLVLIVNEGQRNGWTRGRVLTVIPGRDGRIRQATIQTSAGILRRPVSKLAVLQVQRVSNAEPEPERRYGSGDVNGMGSTDDKTQNGSPSSKGSYIFSPGADKPSHRRSNRLANVNKKQDHLK